MGNLFNSFYYGKAGKGDFTEEQLPGNRWQLFWQTLRVRFTGIIAMNLIFVLFCLPAIAWTYINFTVLTGSVIETVDEAGAVVEQIDAAAVPQVEGGDAAVTSTLTVEDARGLVTTYLLLMVPCMGLIGVGKTGMMYVFRNWARDEHSFMMSDFKDAVKGNWKQGLLLGLLNGLSLLIVWVCWNFYSGMAAAKNPFFTIPQVLIIVLGVIWWMMNMLAFPMMVTYELKFTQILRNCSIMVLARLPLSILVFACGLFVPALCLVLSNFVMLHYILIGFAVYYAALGFGLTRYIYASYANACFDYYLNPRIKGAKVNKGLRVKDDFDDDDDDEKGEK